GVDDAREQYICAGPCERAACDELAGDLDAEGWGVRRRVGDAGFHRWSLRAWWLGPGPGWRSGPGARLASDDAEVTQPRRVAVGAHAVGLDLAAVRGLA